MKGRLRGPVWARLDACSDGPSVSLVRSDVPGSSQDASSRHVICDLLALSTYLFESTSLDAYI
jgi:hypothetical protein